MKLRSGSDIAVPRPAATVMIVRDSHEGMEVFLLKRHARSDFGGAYVFPGGVVDITDTEQELEHYCDGLSALEADRRLNLAAGALAYWVTAIRECFEESGILLARFPGGSALDPRSEPNRKRFDAYRRALHDGELSIRSMCEREGLLLDCRQMHYVSFWTTPVDFERRYSTRFFVARVPTGQNGCSDGWETVDSLWLRPADALSDGNRSQLNLHRPTIANLKRLAGFGNVDDAIATLSAAASGPVPEIVPRLHRGLHGVRIEDEEIWHPVQQHGHD